MIYSGSAVVDFQNSAGFAAGSKKPLIAIFTHARMPFGQAMAYSYDRGRSWHLFNNGKPIVANQGLDPEERDPRVFWSAGFHRWVMVLWVSPKHVRFFTSENLRRWNHSGDFFGDGFYECPDLFELPVDGDDDSRKWILHDASFRYWIGNFDGNTFTADSGPFIGDWGQNFYAAQTWNHTGQRKIQIAWMRNGEYPNMPFNQQMSIPCELTLGKTSRGLRLCRNPVPAVKALHRESYVFFQKMLTPGQAFTLPQRFDTFDLIMNIEFAFPSVFVLRFHNQRISISATELNSFTKTIPIYPESESLRLRILVDRCSIEVFLDGGRISQSNCFVPDPLTTQIQFSTERKPVTIRSLEIHRLASAWENCDRLSPLH